MHKAILFVFVALLALPSILALGELPNNDGIDPFISWNFADITVTPFIYNVNYETMLYVDIVTPLSVSHPFIACDVSTRPGLELITTHFRGDSVIDSLHLYSAEGIPLDSTSTFNGTVSGEDSLANDIDCIDIDGDGYDELALLKGGVLASNRTYLFMMDINESLPFNSTLNTSRFSTLSSIELQGYHREKACIMADGDIPVCGLLGLGQINFVAFIDGRWQETNDYDPPSFGFTDTCEGAPCFRRNRYGWSYYNTTEWYGFSHRQVYHFRWNTANQNMTLVTNVSATGGVIYDAKFLNDIKQNGSTTGNLSNYGGGNGSLVVSTFTSGGRNIVLLDGVTLENRWNSSSSICGSASDSEGSSRSCIQSELLIFDSTGDGYADVHAPASQGAILSPSLGQAFYYAQRWEYNSTTTVLEGADTYTLSSLTVPRPARPITDQTAYILHDWNNEGIPTTSFNSFLTNLSSTSIQAITQSARGGGPLDYPFDANQDGYYDVYSALNASLYFHADGSFTDIDVAPIIARPKFLGEPIRLGDTIRAVTIYRHALGLNASLRIEWFVNTSLLVQNDTLHIDADSSHRVNLSSLYAVPGTNITVFMQALTQNGISTYKNRTATVAIPQCQDGIDNDLDGDIDYPSDTGCSNLLDNTEDTDNPISTVEVQGSTFCGQPSGGGSTVIMVDGQTLIYSQGQFIATEESFQDQDSFLDDLLDRQKQELCGNNKDDNENGLIDDGCVKQIRVQTANLASRYNLFIAPGETRMRDVLVTNIGAMQGTVKMSCEGSTACRYINLAPKEFTLDVGESNTQAVEMSIAMPADIPIGERFALKIIGTDSAQESLDNIIVSITVSEQGAGLRRISEALTRPVYCTDVAREGARNFCVPLWIAVLFAIGVLVFIYLTIVAIRGDQ